MQLPSIPWKIWLYAAGGILLAIGFKILTGDGRKAEKLTLQRDALLLDGTKKAQNLAIKKGKQADKLQADAVEAAKVGQAAINKVGQDEVSMAKFLDSWRADSSV